jgi:hypothetical protein
VSEEARATCLRAGGDDYLRRPCLARDLLARVGSHLALSRLRAADMAAMLRLGAGAMKEGAADFLPTPYGREELLPGIPPNWPILKR